MSYVTVIQTRMCIDGKWCDALNGKTYPVVNPATEEMLWNVAYGGKAETRRALEAAAKAMPAWQKLTAWGKGQNPQEYSRPHV